MASYKLSLQAERDVIRIHQYGVRTFGMAQADEYFADLIEKFHAISNQPLLYPVDDVRGGYRRCVYRSDVIYFREIDGGVEIMAVLGQQDRDEWL